MPDFDVASIVPSSRDLMQALATRRRRLALVAQVSGEAIEADAKRLDDLGVAAFACAAAGPDTAAAARATRGVPVLCLAEIRDREGALTARYHGADGVCLAPDLDMDASNRLAQTVRTTHMLPLVIARSAQELAGLVDAGARAVLVRAPSPREVVVLAAAAPKSTTIVAWPEISDLDGLRSLAGHVDAVLIELARHRDPGFAAFVSDVDP